MIIRLLNLKLYLCCINNNMKDWFMNIDEVQLITFSPTCTSKQVGEAIVHGTGISSVSKVDLTLEAAGKREVPSHALAVITVPVYGGHVAPLALERMKELHADGAPAVVVVVYGNRAYEKALVELDAFVTKLGFKVIAGATFVGEHSYSSEKYPVASGRPDADDLQQAREFGKSSLEKWEKLQAVGTLITELTVKGNFPYKQLTPGAPACPTCTDGCFACGECIEVCPTHAIHFSEDQSSIETDIHKCIKCCACVKCCPNEAREFSTPFAAILHEKFSARRQPELFF